MTNSILSIDKEEETPNAFTDEAKAPDGYVEVDLCLDISYNLIRRDKKGLLDFRTYSHRSIFEEKVYVPIKATESKEALNVYLHEMMEYGNTGITLVNVNIRKEEFVYKWV